MRKCEIAFALTILGCSLNLGQNAQSQTTSILAAADSRVQFFLDAIPVGQEYSYGFQSRLEFASVTPGDPYEVYTLDLQQITNNSSAEKVMLLPVNEWRVPLKVGGESRALLTVSKVDGNWRAVDFGAATLAKELGQHESRTNTRIAERRGILRLYELDVDLLLIRHVNADGEVSLLIPLKTARDAFLRAGMTLNTEYALQEFVPLVMMLYSGRSNSRH